MKLLDRITLLKAGYTRREIDQMIEDEQQAPAAVEQPEPEAAPEPEAEPEAAPEPEPDPEPETDYKSLYEAERKAKEALQKQNRDRDRTDNTKKSDADVVKDVVDSFF